MQKKATKLISYAALFVLGVIILFASTTSIYLQAQDAQERVSPQQLKDLITNAKTPADHEKIAGYYRQEAARLKADAEMHRVDAGLYGKGQGAIHCNNLAKLDDQAAKEAEALATMHQKMGKAAAK